MAFNRQSVWALVGVLALGAVAVPPSPVAMAGTEDPIVDPSADIVTNATTSTQARLDAYQSLSSFLLTQFQFDVQQVVGSRRGDQRIDRLIKQLTKTLDKEQKDAERDLKSIIKDAKRALRHTGGGGANGQLNQLLHDRLDGVDAVRSSATSGIYDILAVET